MATYICLANWTQKGIESIKEGPDRLDAAREVLEEQGITLRDFYMTVGQYDFAFTLEASDAAAVAKSLLAIAQAGNIRTTTLRAFSEDEYREIIGSL
jgi:uncharacterized protein with GYD domain